MQIYGQDREKIINTDKIVDIRIDRDGITNEYMINAYPKGKTSITLGRYAKEEKAKQILDGILRMFNSKALTYYMPPDNEK